MGPHYLPKILEQKAKATTEVTLRATNNTVSSNGAGADPVIY